MLNVTSFQGLVGSINLLQSDKPLHFIAHSRGNPLSLQVFHRLSKYFPNKKIEQFTLLDPHPASTFGDVSSQGGSIENLPCVEGSALNCTLLTGCDDGSHINLKLPDNVITADCYYRKDNIYEGAFDIGGIGSFDGVPVVGLRFNRELSQYWMDLPISIGIPTFSFGGGAHSRVHTWYYGTIENTGRATYGDFNISDTEPVNWYNYVIFPQNINAPVQNLIDGRRTKTGFNYSRIGGLGYPSEPTAKTTLAEMETALAARTGGFGLRPVFNGDFQYGDGKSGWTLNGGVFAGSVQQFSGNNAKVKLATNEILKHSYFYFPNNSSSQYLQFLMAPTGNTIVVARQIRIVFESTDGNSYSIYEGVLSNVAIDQQQYVYCPIPSFLNGKAGKFSVTNLLGGDILLDDFTFATGIPPANNTLHLVSTVVPVELLSFKIKQVENNTQLAWQTATERSSDHFDIERSTDGKQFGKIGEVKAHGSTNQMQNYGYLDTSLPPQYNLFYYRLQQVDKDNKAEYSPIRSIRIDKQDKSSIKIYPNPNNGQFIATIPTDNKNTDVTIQNSHGQVIWKGIIAEGQQSQNIQLDQAANGLYFVSCRNSEGIINSVKFVINR